MHLFCIINLKKSFNIPDKWQWKQMLKYKHFILLFRCFLRCLRSLSLCFWRAWNQTSSSFIYEYFLLAKCHRQDGYFGWSITLIASPELGETFCSEILLSYCIILAILNISFVSLLIVLSKLLGMPLLFGSA